MVSKQALACSNLHRAIFSIASFPAPPVIDSTRQNGFVLWQSHLNELAFWCFLFVTLFNLQGTRHPRRNIAIILAFIRFVKNFFQVLFKSSGPYSSSLPPRLAPLSDSFARIPNLCSLVKAQSQISSKNFSARRNVRRNGRNSGITASSLHRRSARSPHPAFRWPGSPPRSPRRRPRRRAAAHRCPRCRPWGRSGTSR